MAETYHIQKWDEYQHYKTANPKSQAVMAWVKWYGKILNNPIMLESWEVKGLWPYLLLIAAEHDGHFVMDEWLAHRLALSLEELAPKVRRLVDLGLLYNDSRVSLESVYNESRVEERREEERREERTSRTICQPATDPTASHSAPDGASGSLASRMKIAGKSAPPKRDPWRACSTAEKRDYQRSATEAIENLEARGIAAGKAWGWMLKRGMYGPAMSRAVQALAGRNNGDMPKNLNAWLTKTVDEISYEIGDARLVSQSRQRQKDERRIDECLR
ncbi:MAG: hypothetical protein ACE5FA_07120 [Dehalococcoidia bacterium]